MNPFDSLIETVRTQLSGNESPDELNRLLAAAGIPEAMFDELGARLQPALSPPPLPTSLNANIGEHVASAPKLLVDWGAHPQVGHQARPCFMILGSAYEYARPHVELRIDDELDFPDAPSAVRVMSLGGGQWEFHASFGLTTSGSDCRPGQYLIQVRVNFEDLHDSSLSSFFQSTIRLTVGQLGDAGPTLEIDGDGQSIVNLNGQDLRSFGKVVLRGNDQGIINLQAVDDQTAPVTAEQYASGNVTHEYVLKPDMERQTGLPAVAAGFERQRHETAVLVFEDGRRVLLLPKRRVTLGRNRDNDIVIRFLPRSAENDALSRNISRTHLILTLDEEGLLLTDDSKTGAALDFDPIDGDRLVTIDGGDDPLDLELGITQRLRLEPFLCRLQLFGSHANAVSIEDDRSYCTAVGESVSRLWRLSQDSRIDSARLQRGNNMAGQEEYVCLYRQVLIGTSQSRCAITIDEAGLPAVAARILHIGRTFWLENLSATEDVSVNNAPLPRISLAPLSPSTRLTFGGTDCRFELPGQLEP